MGAHLFQIGDLPTRPFLTFFNIFDDAQWFHGPHQPENAVGHGTYPRGLKNNGGAGEVLGDGWAGSFHVARDMGAALPVEFVELTNVDDHRVGTGTREVPALEQLQEVIQILRCRMRRCHEPDQRVVAGTYPRMIGSVQVRRVVAERAAERWNSRGDLRRRRAASPVRWLIPKSGATKSKP